MIEDIINNKLKEKTKYYELDKKITEERQKLMELKEEKNNTYNKNKRLEHFAFIAKTITLICCLINIHAIISYIIIFIAKKKAEEITTNNKLLYDKEIQSLNIKIEKEQQILLNIYYNACDEVEKDLSPLKEEVKYHITNRNYETLINNHTRYENILPLIENEWYYKILCTLIELGKKGININSLSNEEKRNLDKLNFLAQKLDYIYNEQKQETLGERQRRWDEELSEKERQEWQNILKKKR